MYMTFFELRNLEFQLFLSWNWVPGISNLLTCNFKPGILEFRPW